MIEFEISVNYDSPNGVAVTLQRVIKQALSLDDLRRRLAAEAQAEGRTFRRIYLIHDVRLPSLQMSRNLPELQPASQEA